MINTILEGINIGLAYRRGKQTGAAGLLGFALFFLIAFSWKDYVYPFLEMIGLIGLAEQIGLIQEQPYMTALYVFLFWIFLCILLPLLGVVIGLPILLIIGLLSNTKYGGKIGLGILYVIFFSPLLILGAMIVVVILVLGLVIQPRSTIEYLKSKNPSYQKKTFIESGKHNEIFKEISAEDTFNRLNRIPTNGDNYYLIGLTSDHKWYVLLPSPYYFQDSIIGVRMKGILPSNGDRMDTSYEAVVNNVRFYDAFQMDMILQENTLKPTHIRRKEHLESDKPDIYRRPEKVKSTDIIQYFDVSELQEFMDFFSHIATSDYTVYMDKVQFEYIDERDAYISALLGDSQSKHYDNWLKDIQLMTASNTDVVSIMRYGRTNTWEGVSKEE
ncbi:hypothetical protein ACFSCX_06880 [Bacillus salitolerans]|uniref:Uncharacterized protein n=1 Tax=Bacillus salitolerans TaxID=1437434 RepID=A0ABW4LM80_9BACI